MRSYRFWLCGSVFNGVVAASFVGGLTHSCGLLYTYMQVSLDLSVSNLSWIGGLMTCFIGLAHIVASFLVVKLGCRRMSLLGPLFASCGLIASSQISNFYALYVTLGVLPGFGIGLNMAAANIAIGQQFRKWRPVAAGIASSGSAIGTQIWPPFTAAMADIYGWRGALLINGGIVLNLLASSMFIKPTSKPVSRTEAATKKTTTSIENLCSIKLIIALLTWLLYGMGFMIFTTFLPKYVISTISGVTKITASFMVSLFGFGNLVGRILLSFLAMTHTKGPQIVLPLSMVVCGVSNLVVPIQRDTLSLQINSAIQGVFNGGSNAQMVAFAVNVFGLKKFPIVLGCVGTMVGLGSLIAPPFTSHMAKVYGIDEVTFYLGGSFYILGAVFGIIVLVCNMGYNEDVSESMTVTTDTSENEIKDLI